MNLEKALRQRNGTLKESKITNLSIAFNENDISSMNSLKMWGFFSYNKRNLLIFPHLHLKKHLASDQFNFDPVV